MKAKLSQLRYKASFNIDGAEEMPNGVYKTVPELLFEFRYGVYKRSMEYMVTKDMYPELKNTISIMARHDDRFIAGSTTGYSVTIGSTTYTIVDVDVDSEINGIDVLTLKAVK